MYSSSCVVSIEIHAKVSLSITVVRAPVVFAKDGGEMFGVFAAYIFYSEVVHTHSVNDIGLKSCRHSPGVSGLWR
jgi:hypothetical protein